MRRPTTGEQTDTDDCRRSMESNRRGVPESCDNKLLPEPCGQVVDSLRNEAPLASVCADAAVLPDVVARSSTEPAPSVGCCDGGAVSAFVVAAVTAVRGCRKPRVSTKPRLPSTCRPTSVVLPCTTENGTTEHCSVSSHGGVQRVD